MRERTSDIPALLQHFITRKSKELKLPDIPTLAPGAIDPLMAYHWPGNVRELENVVERALILNPSGPLKFDNLGLPLDQRKGDRRTQVTSTDNLNAAMSIHIQRVLAKTNGKIHGKGGAAALMGINASTLRNRMNKLGISYRK